MPRFHTEETVIVPETHERDRWELQHQLRWRAPDGTAHGNDIEIKEIFPITTEVGVFTQRHLRELRIFQCINGLLIEAIYLQDEAPEAWTDQIATLTENEVQALTVVFIACGFVPHSEGHVCPFGFHIKLAEKPS